MWRLRGALDSGSSTRSGRPPPACASPVRGAPIHPTATGSTRLRPAVQAANEAGPWCPAPRPPLRRSCHRLEALVQEAPACEDLTGRALSGIRAWEQAVIDAADAAGLLGLALLTFTEAIIHPIPPDLLILPMAAAADGSSRLISIWIVATLTSVAGAIVGSWLGAGQADRCWFGFGRRRICSVLRSCSSGTAPSGCSSPASHQSPQGDGMGCWHGEDGDAPLRVGRCGQPRPSLWS